MMKKTSTITAFAVYSLCLSFVTSTEASLINIAPTGTTSASGEFSPASNVNDEIHSTYWNGGGEGSLSAPHWVQIDLGDVVSVRQIYGLWGNVIDGRYAGYTNTYHFYSSMNGADWTLLHSGTFVDESPDPDDYEYTLDFGATGEDLRYVKHEVVGGSHWAFLSEIEIYEVPEPSGLALLSIGLLGGLIHRKK